MGEESKCLLLNNMEDLEAAIASRPKIFVLFYATWCPYSRKFLPEFEQNANAREECHGRIILDDADEIADKYGIEVYPTVLYFENGKLAKRLDGAFHVGLDKHQLSDFVEVCVRKVS